MSRRGDVKETRAAAPVAESAPVVARVRVVHGSIQLGEDRVAKAGDTIDVSPEDAALLAAWGVAALVG